MPFSYMMDKKGNGEGMAQLFCILFYTAAPKDLLALLTLTAKINITNTEFLSVYKVSATLNDNWVIMFFKDILKQAFPYVLSSPSFPLLWGPASSLPLHPSPLQCGLPTGSFLGAHRHLQASF